MNKIIEEIGWSRSFSGGGYEPTKQGLRKDVLRLESQKGTPYCSYPPGIIHDIALISRFADISPASARFSNVSPIQTQSSQGNSGDCVCYCGKCSLLGKSQKYKTRDGHFVRSRGEVMIDNYLYTSRVAHAYELDLILTDSERMSPDFTVLTPNGNVYIEFWGLEGQPDYDKNTEKKKRLYEKHDLSLINVRPDDLDNLDSILSQETRAIWRSNSILNRCAKSISHSRYSQKQSSLSEGLYAMLIWKHLLATVYFLILRIPNQNHHYF